MTSPPYYHTRAVTISYANASAPLLSVSQVLALPDGDEEKERRVNLDPLVESADEGGSRSSRKKPTQEEDDVWEVSGVLNVGSQHHFYLEPHSAVVTPLEDGRFEIVSSTQHMDGCQMVAAK